jgi:hypothetical protein
VAKATKATPCLYLCPLLLTQQVQIFNRTRIRDHDYSRVTTNRPWSNGIPQKFNHTFLGKKQNYLFYDTPKSATDGVTRRHDSSMPKLQSIRHEIEPSILLDNLPC